MARPGPNRKILAAVLSAVFVLTTLLAGVLALMRNNPYDETDKPSSSAVETMKPAEGEEESQQEPSSSDEAEPDSADGEDASAPEESAPAEPEPAQPAEPPAEEPVFYNVPDTLRAVTITAGRDYLLTPQDTDRAKLASQIDAALNAAKELTMNAVIIDTKYNDSVLFTSSALQMAQVDLDCTEYMVSKARELGFYVYATYDVSDAAGEDGVYRRASSASGQTLDEIADNIGEFAEKYKVDGILLNNYEAPTSPAAYAQYLRDGGGVGYQNYLRQVPQAMVTAAAASVRTRAPGTQVGLLAEAVWENSSVNPDGPETKAETTALGTGNADTRAFVQSGLFDFVMVENFGSTNEEAARFGVVAEWWTKLCEDAGTTLYILHASDRVGTQSVGWTVYEQLTKQVIDLGKMSGISGSAFNSLKALLANPGNSTTTLVQYLNNEINESWVLEQLSISKPAQFTYTTKEPTVAFQGASDPQADVTINGEKVPRNESGYFAISEDLKEGLNTFVIVHKGKTFTYNITREIIVLKEIQPTGSIAVDGDMTVTITALAYKDSTVTATIGGQTVTLTPSETDDDSTDRDSAYLQYVGVFTAPSASSSPTQMGTIKVTATSADGVSKTLEGASVTVNKKVQMGEGVVVQVSSEQAETFPVDTLSDISTSNYYPLPQGTVDKTYGSEVVYKNGKDTKTYWRLESGVRVYSQDITTGGQMPDNNEISSMSTKSSGAYTTLTLTTGSKVPYTVSYDGNKLVFKFAYTAKVPESKSFDSSNALFKSAEWSGSSLTLNLKKTGGFLGYKAYYDGANKLILRFNNSPGSLSGARIVVDPGHGGNDPGTLGFYPGKDEADINLAIAKKLVNELKGRGASVLMATPGSTMASRLASARAFNPQVLVSVHGNSSPNRAAKGAEVYYFYPFQKQLAANVSANIAASLGTENRGAKQGLYYMTRESQFACVLAETGFFSNEDEYVKLINSKYQTRVAQGIANAISGYLGGTNSGGGTGGGDEEEEEGSSSEESSSSDAELILSDESLSLDKGETHTLKAERDGEAVSVSWKSSNSTVAAVSSGGKITAKAEGSVTITATAKNGEKATCEVEVGGSGDSESESSTDDDTFSLNKTSASLQEGATLTLTANMTVKTWESDDEDIATVSSSGKVTAVGEGTAWITATTRSGDSVDCKITVGESDRSGGLVKSISISGPTKLEVGRRIQLDASVSPSNAADPGVKWTSSNNDIANVSQVKDSNGNVIDNSVKVEGNRDGTVKITATAYDDGKVKATYTVKVGDGVYTGSSSSSSSDEEYEESSSGKGTPGVLVTSINISGNSSLTKGRRADYTATVKPSDAEDRGVKWTVSDSDILQTYPVYRSDGTVDETRIKVEGLHTGTAYLIGTAYDEGKVSVRFKITVKS